MNGSPLWLASVLVALVVVSAIGLISDRRNDRKRKR